MSKDSSAGRSDPGRWPVRVFSDARGAQRVLCDEVLEAAEALAGEPARAFGPLEVVVPSGNLRGHLVQRLLASCRRGGLVGVRVSTLEGFAELLVAGDEVSPPVSRGLYGLVVERAARAEAVLAEALGPMAGGYAAVGACVDDLLDAGFHPLHEEALGDCLAEVGVGDPRARRATALVGVACQAWRTTESSLVAHRSRLFARAHERIERDAGSALLVSGLWVVGFADATGVQADFLESLVRRCGAKVLLERPADLAGTEDPGELFGARLRERLEAVAGLEDRRADLPAEVPRIELLRAPDREAEVRGLALRLRAHLDAGEVPESIAVVARDLEPYALSLRRWLGRLGVPFSGRAQRAAAGPAARRVAALCALLEAGGAAGIEVWLDALGALPSEPRSPARELSLDERSDLLHALHRRGCVRVRDLADLEALAEPELALPGRDQRGERRRLAGAQLLAASQAAVALFTQLEAAPGRAPLGGHLSWLRELLGPVLGWAADTPGAVPLAEALGDSGLAAADDFDLSHEEFRGLLLGALEGAGREPLGGAGGGVQVLGVMEARGLCFERIFLLGVNRGVFPRSISEDPLLPDALRATLRSVLPDLPIKREGHDEERFLFAQLMGQAPEVTLSWAASADDGVQLLPSALVEGLRAAGVAHASGELPPLHAPHASLGSVALPAMEHALLAGVHAGHTGQAAALEVALQALEVEGVEGRARAGLRERAAARLAVVSEFDAYAGEAAGLGPYFGFVGRPAGPAAGSPDAPSVTFVEAMARCAWRAFVTRVLGVEPTRDALAVLPSPGGDPRLLGSVVHAALEVLVGDALSGSPLDLESEGTPVPRPQAARVEQVVQEMAERELREAAIPIPSFARVIAGVALPMVFEAFERDWSEDEPPRVLGVEVSARVEVPDAAGTLRALRFRADRVDRVAGALRLSDYKTGASAVTGKRPDTRRKKLLRGIARGELLQAAVYAQLAPGAEGRYLHLATAQPEEVRAPALVGDPEVGAALAQALDVVLGARDAGVYVPHLLDFGKDQEPRACARCEVKEACLRGDSGARGRLRRFVEGAAALGRGTAPYAAARLLRLDEAAP